MSFTKSSSMELRQAIVGGSNVSLKNSFDPRAAVMEEINKAMAGGHSFELQELLEQVEFRTFLKPDLLTNILNPNVTSHISSAFQWDVVTKSLQRVAGKSRSEDGPSVIKSTKSQRTASIPAFGITGEVSAEDVYLRRKAGTVAEMEAINELMAEVTESMMSAFDILNEDAMVELLTNDQNIVLGGPYQAQEWHSVYEGSSRPAATDLLMGTATPESVRDAFNEAIDRVEENLKRRGLRARGYVNVCGKSMFNKLVDVETALGADYDIRPTLNLKIEAIPAMMIGEHRYRNFTSAQTGVTHIQYQASMVGGTDGGGAPMIGDNDSYLIPIGVENMFTIELAPDITFASVNTLAQPMYTYYEQNNYEMRVAASTNRLYMNRVPNAIVAFTTST